MANEKRLIDREKLLDKLTWLAKNEDQFRQSVICGVMHTIAVTPAVDAVEVVHGEWIDKYEIKSFRHTNIPVVQCSKCECYFCDIINNHHFMYRYCPNCGATMDGGKDDE